MGCADSRAQQNQESQQKDELPKPRPSIQIQGEILDQQLSQTVEEKIQQHEENYENKSKNKCLKKLSEKQQEEILSFIESIKNHQKNKYLCKCSYLFRFFKCTNFDNEKAFQMIAKHFQWVEENDTKNILKDFLFFEHQNIYKIYKHGFHKTDKKGRPLYIEKLQGFSIEELFTKTTEERIKKHYIQLLEYLCQKIFPVCTFSNKSEKFINNIIIILDFQDFNLKPFQFKRFIIFLLSIFEQNYPEIIKNIYIVNESKLIGFVQGVLQQILPEKTYKKIVLLGNNPKAKLLEMIHKENLPDFLGGESDTMDGTLLQQNLGPWNQYGCTKHLPHQKSFNVSQQQKKELEDEIEKFQQNQKYKEERMSQRNSVNNSRATSHRASYAGSQVKQSIIIQENILDAIEVNQ